MYLDGSKIIVIKIGSSLLIDKNKKSEVTTLSTLDKESISKIKAKLLSYVS